MFYSQGQNKNKIIAYLWQYLCLVSCVAVLVSACSTTTLTTDALSDLEELQDSNGDIDIVMDVSFQASNQLNLNLVEADVEWTYFTAKTPKGGELSGIAVFEPNDSNVTLNFEKLRFKGSITKIQEQKAMLGVLSTNLNAQIDGFTGTFVLTKSGASFSELAQGDSFNLGDLINTRKFEEIKVTASLETQELDKSSTKLTIGKLQSGAAFLGYSGKVTNLETESCSQATGQLSFTGKAETSQIGSLLKGEGALCNNEVIEGIIGIIIGWKVEVGE